MLLSELIKSYGDWNILSFEQTGKAVRLLKPIYGKISQSVEIVSIPKLNLPPLCKKVVYDFFSYMNPQRKIEQDEKYQLCRQSLKDADIPAYYATRENGCGSLIYLYRS